MIHIVTALPCEAKPLIRHYRLNGRQAENSFRIYENGDMRLIVAGVGKIAAAAASAYLQGQAANSLHAWLNLGVGGHHSLPVGELVLASKITDATNNTNWYPPLVFKAPCQRRALLSVDSPDTEYRGDCVYEMEAAGFYATTCRFSSTELLQVCKVISDNHAHPADKVTAPHVEEIITARLEAIDEIIQALNKQLKQLEQQTTPAVLNQFLERWRFSVSQQHQLQRLLQRWQARSGETPEPQMFAAAHNGKAVIKQLQQQIQQQPMRFDDAS